MIASPPLRGAGTSPTTRPPFGDFSSPATGLHSSIGTTTSNDTVRARLQRRPAHSRPLCLRVLKQHAGAVPLQSAVEALGRGLDMWIQRLGIDEFLTRLCLAWSSSCGRWNKLKPEAVGAAEELRLSAWVRDSWKTGHFWFNQGTEVSLNIDHIYSQALHEPAQSDGVASLDQATQAAMEQWTVYREEHAVRFLEGEESEGGRSQQRARTSRSPVYGVGLGRNERYSRGNGTQEASWDPLLSLSSWLLSLTHSPLPLPPCLFSWCIGSLTAWARLVGGS